MAQSSFTSSADFNQRLLQFLQASPTPYHAVASVVSVLQEHGFTELKETQSWSLQTGQGYYLVRNDSSVIAFRHGDVTSTDAAIRMAGAHTDSPCLKVKPQPHINKHGYEQLGVEVYGGALLAPWFDRDLSLAGKVTWANSQGQLRSSLLDIGDPIAVIPSLAIHLDRDANQNRSINAQTDIVPLLHCKQQGDFSLPDFLKERLQEDNSGLDIDRILDYDLSFYDVQPPALIGLHQEFLASARLDNLLSCFIELYALIDADPAYPSLVVFNDHEEVGSASACGAQGPMLSHCLERMIPNADTRLQVIQRSLMMSVDNAHALHPNYPSKHDSNHGPVLNSGPVIKVNANQRYATNTDTASVFKQLCHQLQVPTQTFVTRTDMACGSTIGPITASEVGIPTLDVGVPTFAMHSVRELAGSDDAYSLWQVIRLYFSSPLQLPQRA